MKYVETGKAVYDLRSEGMTFEQIGKMMNMSLVAARQYHNKYRKHLDKLKESELYRILVTTADCIFGEDNSGTLVTSAWHVLCRNECKTVSDVLALEYEIFKAGNIRNCGAGTKQLLDAAFFGNKYYIQLSGATKRITNTMRLVAKNKETYGHLTGIEEQILKQFSEGDCNLSNPEAERVRLATMYIEVGFDRAIETIVNCALDYVEDKGKFYMDFACLNPDNKNDVILFLLSKI